MEVIKTDIDGVLIIEPRIFKDARGYFFESFSQREFDEKVAPILGHPIHFCQDNESMSSYGVMRGLHFQRPPFTQSKLVRCVKGAVLDVAVDIRKGSPTYGKHVAVELTEDNHRQFLFHVALPMVLLYSAKLPCSSISAMSSIILRLTGESLSSTRAWASTGRFLQSMLFSLRRILSMIC